MANQKILFSKSELTSLQNSAFSHDQIELINILTPAKEVEIKTDIDGNKYKSVKASFVKKRLNIIFGFDYDFEILKEFFNKEKQECIVKGQLTIRTGLKTIIRQQYGKHSEVSSIGNGYKSAASDALKKCASEIGICWDIYTQKRPESTTKSETYSNDKIFDRLNHFLKECDTVIDVQEVFYKFEQDNKVEQKHKDLLELHIKRTMKK